MRVRLKKVLSIVTALSMAASMGYNGGTTVKADAVLDNVQQDENGVYLIYTAEELVEFIKNADAGIDAKLMADITFEDGYTDVGFGEEDAIGMEFDGNGHTISNFNMNGTKESIFYSLKDSTVKNLNIHSNIDVGVEEESTETETAEAESETTEEETGSGEDSESAGVTAVAMLAYGAENSIIDNCTLSGEIKADENVQYVGGFVALAITCTIIKCTNEADISAYGWIGGITSYAKESIIDNCINEGKLTGNTYAAGVVAVALKTTISSCTNNGPIDSFMDQEVMSYGIGGVAALACTSTIEFCENNGTICAEGGNCELAAGIVARTGGKTMIMQCVNNEKVYAGVNRYTSGGIVAYAATNSIYTPAAGGKNGLVEVMYCINNADVSNNIDDVAEDYYDYAGGIVGILYDEMGTYYSSIANCQNYGNVTADKHAGGIAGCAFKGIDLWRCANNGTIVSGVDAGSICGYAVSCIGTYLYNTGTVITGNGITTTMIVDYDDSCEIMYEENNHTHDYTEYKYSEDTILASWEDAEEGEMIPVDGLAYFVCGCGYDNGTQKVVPGIKEIYLTQTAVEYNGTEKEFPEGVVKDANGNEVNNGDYFVWWTDSEGESVYTINKGGSYTATMIFLSPYDGVWEAEITVTEVTTAAQETTTVAQETTTVAPETTTVAPTTTVSETTTTVTAEKETTTTANINVKKSKVLKAVRTSNKKAKITFRKVAGATSYQIQVSTNKKFKAKKTRTIKAKKTTKTIKKLKAGKKYYVRVRAIKKANGVSYKGKWSKAKIVKAKVNK